MAELSKTARASVQAGEGVRQKPPVAWGFYRRTNGGMHKRPDRTFYVMDEAEAWEQMVGSDGYLVKSTTLNSGTRR